MSQFDFVGDESLRASLDADYGELQKCLHAEAWKSVHVLAGSIIEAILIDYLLAIGYNKTEPLKMSLDQAIQACKDENVIISRTAELSNVIRSYRNLIHPGRAIRLNDTVDAETAKVSDALVRIVIQDISSRKSASYGYTAEQIVSKLQRDPSARAILENLLAELKEREKEKLLLSTIPDQYLEGVQSQTLENEVLLVWKECFLITFKLVSDSIKHKVTSKFVSLVKEGSRNTVITYADAFFKATHLEYIPSPTDRDIVKKHLLSRLESDNSASIFPVLEGISSFLSEEERKAFVAALIRKYVKESVYRDRIEHFLGWEYYLSKEIESTVDMMAKDYIEWFSKKDNSDLANLVQDFQKNAQKHKPPF